MPINISTFLPVQIFFINQQCMHGLLFCISIALLILFMQLYRRCMAVVSSCRRMSGIFPVTSVTLYYNCAIYNSFFYNN